MTYIGLLPETEFIMFKLFQSWPILPKADAEVPVSRMHKTTRLPSWNISRADTWMVTGGRRKQCTVNTCHSYMTFLQDRCALLTIAKKWKQQRCPPSGVDEDSEANCTRGLYSAIKKT